MHEGSRRLRVVVADDQPIFCRGLKEVIAADDSVALLASAVEPQDLRKLLGRQRPDAIVLGLSGPGSADQPWFDALPDSARGRTVLALTDSSDGNRLATCIHAGIRSLAPRSIAPEDLVAGLKRVAAGEVFLGTGAIEAIMREVARRAAATDAPLTARELEILKLLAAGQKAPDIAAALVVERTTVRTHLQNLFEKLGVSNQAGAVGEGMRRGLLG